jgi:hypothetical protein
VVSLVIKEQKLVLCRLCNLTRIAQHKRKLEYSYSYRYTGPGSVDMHVADNGCPRNNCVLLSFEGTWQDSILKYVEMQFSLQMCVRYDVYAICFCLCQGQEHPHLG